MFRILGEVGNSERQVAIAHFRKHIRRGIVEDRGIVPGAHPAHGARLSVDHGQMHGHESFALMIGGDETVQPIRKFGEAAGRRGAIAEHRPHASHDQGGRDPVPHHIAEHDQHRVRGGLVQNQKVVVIASGLVAIGAVSRHVETANLRRPTRQETLLHFHGDAK